MVTAHGKWHELSGKGNGARQIGKSQGESGKSKIMKYLETYSKKNEKILIFIINLYLKLNQINSINQRDCQTSFVYDLC